MVYEGEARALDNGGRQHITILYDALQEAC